jgi:hypothetical protein
MESKNEVDIKARVLEIERLIAEFKEKFEAGTSDADNFITMNEIERLWGELRGNTDNIYSDIVQGLMRTVDEGDLIRKKKGNTEIKE